MLAQLEELLVLLLGTVEFLDWVGRHLIIVSVDVPLVIQSEQQLSSDLERFLSFVLPGLAPPVFAFLQIVISEVDVSPRWVVWVVEEGVRRIDEGVLRVVWQHSPPVEGGIGLHGASMGRLIHVLVAPLPSLCSEWLKRIQVLDLHIVLIRHWNSRSVARLDLQIRRV